MVDNLNIFLIITIINSLNQSQIETHVLQHMKQSYLDYIFSINIHYIIHVQSIHQIILWF